MKELALHDNMSACAPEDNMIRRLAEHAVPHRAKDFGRWDIGKDNVLDKW